MSAEQNDNGYYVRPGPVCAVCGAIETCWCDRPEEFHRESTLAFRGSVMPVAWAAQYWMDQVDTIRAALDAAREDSERMDWLESEGGTNIWQDRGKWVLGTNDPDHPLARGDSLRAALDAASPTAPSGQERSA